MIRIFHDWRGLPEDARGATVALGNFDGFHLGHQAVVGRAVTRARAEGRPAIVGTFDPHPKRFFRPEFAAYESEKAFYVELHGGTPVVS